MIAISPSGNDDTAAIQAAINTAQANGDEVKLDGNVFHTSSPLIVSDRLTLWGRGYQDDAGGGYNPLFTPFSPIPATLKGTIILPGAHDTFQIASNRAIKMQDFQISYDQNAASGLNLAGIRLSSSGTGSCNNRSVLRDLCITNADTGIAIKNAMEFRLDNVNVPYFWKYGVNISSPDYPSYGDSLITNSTLWGQSVSSGVAHIVISSGGGLRIVNNKLNVGSGTGGSGILLQPNLAVAQTMEPIIITGNSIEGQAVGINIANSNPNNADITELVITGNQIWSGVNAIRVNANGIRKWLSGLTICGNALMAVNTTNQRIISLDNAQIGIISGNNFALSGGGAGTACYFGTHTTAINLQSNAYAQGLTACLNQGVGNTIGGGSA